MNANEFFADASGVYEPQAAVVKPYDVSSWFTELGYTEDETKVTSLNAIKHGLVWSAVNVIAGDVGQIPMQVCRIQGERTELVENHPVHRALNYQPNPYQTPAVWAEFMMSQVLIWGNAFSRIVWDGFKKKLELHPLPAEFVTYYVDEGGTPFYWVTLPETTPFPLELSDVLHFKGLTNNGFWGHRLVEVAYPELQFTRSVIRHASNTFDNGAVPRGVLQHPGKLPPEARDQLRKDWNKVHQGASNSGKIGILWEGMVYNAMSVSNQDAQMLESLQEDAVIVGRLFQIPPYKLGDYRNNATRANLEDSQKEYFNQTLSRRLVMMVQEMNVKLFPPTSGLHRVKPDPTELLKGDKQTQVETAASAVSGLLWTQNEGRAYIGMNPVQGGEQFINPNTTPGPGSTDGPEETEEPDTEEQDSEMESRVRELVLAQARVVAVMERNKVKAKQKAKHRSAVIKNYYAKDFFAYAVDKLRHAHSIAGAMRSIGELDGTVEQYAGLSQPRAIEVDAEDWDIDQNARELASLVLGETL